MVDYSYSRLFRARKDWCHVPERYRGMDLPIPTTPFGSYKSGNGGWPSWAQVWEPLFINKVKKGVIYPKSPKGRKPWSKMRNFMVKRRKTNA